CPVAGIAISAYRSAHSIPEKTTSNATKACVSHENEEEQWSHFASTPRHGLCAGGNGTNGVVLPGAPRESGGGSTSPMICSRRALGGAARPKRGRRNPRHWVNCRRRL